MDDAMRRRLRQNFERLLGDPDQADALMDHLTPDGDRPASSAELARLRSEMDQGFAGVNRRIDGLEQRFDGLEQRFDGLEKHGVSTDHRFDLLTQQIDQRFAAQDEKHRADLHELVGVRLATQTRTMMVSIVGAITANTAVVLAASQLG